MFVNEDVIIISSEQSLQNSSIKLILPLYPWVSATSKQLNQMESSFGFLGSFDKINQSLNVLFIGKFGHVVKKYFQQELRYIGSFMLFSINGLRNQFRDDAHIILQQICRVETLLLHVLRLFIRRFFLFLLTETLLIVLHNILIILLFFTYFTHKFNQTKRQYKLEFAYHAKKRRKKKLNQPPLLWDIIYFISILIEFKWINGQKY